MPHATACSRTGQNTALAACLSVYAMPVCYALLAGACISMSAGVAWQLAGGPGTCTVSEACVDCQSAAGAGGQAPAAGLRRPVKDEVREVGGPSPPVE